MLEGEASHDAAQVRYGTVRCGTVHGDGLGEEEKDAWASRPPIQTTTLAKLEQNKDACIPTLFQVQHWHTRVLGSVRRDGLTPRH